MSPPKNRVQSPAPISAAPAVQRRPKDVRERLLSAALELFTRDGFHAATLDSIAAHAGLTKGAVYSNFSGKRELFLALLEQQVTQRADIARATVLEVSQLSGGDRDAVTAALASRLEQLSASQEGWQQLYIEFWLFAMRDPVARQLLLDARRRLRNTLARIVEETEEQLAVHTGIAPTDLATTILSLSNGLALEVLIDPDAASEGLLATLLNRILSDPHPVRDS